MTENWGNVFCVPEDENPACQKKNGSKNGKDGKDRNLNSCALKLSPIPVPLPWQFLICWYECLTYT